MVLQVTNHPELHEYAARQTIEALKRGANHDAMVGAAAAIVGEPPGPSCGTWNLLLRGMFQRAQPITVADLWSVPLPHIQQPFGFLPCFADK